MSKVLIATIEQTIRKEVPVPEHIPTGEFSIDALDVLNAVNASDHSTLIKQRFLAAEVIEVSGDER